MEIVGLTKKALELRKRFDEAARKAGKREWSKEEIMQGFVVDVGALTKFVMAKSGVRELEDVDKKLAHELADCLWSVLVLADAYAVDLEKVFLEMIEQVSENLDMKKAPNQSPEPTPTAVTIPAGAGLAPAAVVAHL